MESSKSSLGKTITLTIKEYKRLVLNDIMLGALEEAGVDNWEGYDDAREIYLEQIKDLDD